MHESTESGMLQMTSSRTLLVHSFEQDTVDPTNRYSLMLILFLRCLRHPLFDVWSPERRGYVQDMFCDVFMLQDVRDPCLFSWQLQQSMWMVRDSSWSLFVWFAPPAQSQDVNEPVFGFYLVHLIIAIHIVCLVRSSSTVARCEWSCSGIPFRCSIPVLVKQDVNEPVLGIPCRIVIQWHFISWLVF